MAPDTSTVMAASPEERLRALDRALAGPERQSAILAALNDETTLVREHAISLAARYLQPELLGELIRDEANAVLRNAAQAALERQGPYAVQHLILLAHDADTDVAMFAVQVLGKICDPSTETALLPLLDHRDPNLVQAAIEALGGIRARTAVPQLVCLLDSDPWLQFAAVAALGQIGDSRAVSALLAHMEDELLAESIADALGQIGSSEALLPLVAVMSTGDRLPQRDRFLLAVAAILEREPLSQPTAARLRRSIAAPAARELTEYLRLVLELDDDALARAAVVLVFAARIDSLLPAVFTRACECADDTAAIASLSQRFRSVLRSQVTALLSHPDLRVRKGALMAAPLNRTARDVALAFLDDDDVRVRIAACVALTRTPWPGAAPKLVNRLLNGGQEESNAAAEALGRCPGGQLQALAPGLSDQVTPELQVACLGVLAAARSSLFQDRVKALLSSDSLSVRRAALRATVHYPCRVFDAIAEHCMEDGDPALKLDVIEYVSRRGCASAAPFLLSLLERHAEHRYHVIRALGRLRDPALAAHLIKLYPQCLRHERIEIATALAHVGTAESCAFLEARLNDGDPDLRRAAADGVARLATAGQIAVLTELAQDPDWVVRNHAAWGLGRLSDPASRATLLTLARDVTPVVARAARAALSKLEGFEPQRGPS